jgi:CubicO group peptidase (beta-lactamase class C family)
LLVTAVAAGLLLVRVPLQADDLLYGRFGEYVESLRVQIGIPAVAVVMVGRNGIVWERAFGNQDNERSIAARTDAPMHLDGLTEPFAATLVLGCVEEGRLTLDQRVGEFRSSSPDANLSIGNILTHTSGPNANPTYSYRPDRLDILSTVIRSCTTDSYRENLANLLDRTAMRDSVPGPDVPDLVPPAEGILTDAKERYERILQRLPVAYTVNSQKKATPTLYSAETLKPTSGLIASVRDYAQFDLALRNGILLKTTTLAMAWRGPVGGDGQRLPHGLGWFVQNYNGESLVWQFGNTENGSSSMVITVPARSLTVILVANSNGLSKGFQLSSGDVTTSPFARAFLGLFVI